MKTWVQSYWAKWLGHTFLCALFIIIAFTLSDFINTPIKSATDITTAILHMSIIFIACWSFIIFLSILPTVLFTLGYGFIVIIASILSFYRYTINFSLNTMMLDIVFKNDIKVSADMVTWEIFIWVISFTIIGFFLSIMHKYYSINFKDKLTYIILTTATLSFVILITPNGRFSRPIKERIPFNIYAVTQKYIEEFQEISKERPRKFQIATSTTDSLVVIVVIGEALRPQNMSINGYHRKTTPRLEALQVISFSDIYSEYVYTNRSVPHILTPADSIHTEYAYTERSFIDVFKAVNFSTTFIANQDAETPYVYFMEEANNNIKVNKSKTVYNFEKWLDEDMLPYYNQTLETDTLQSLIILHCIGSHWWYNSHYSNDFEIFKPTMKSRIVSNCDSMEIVNSYDNTVCYTDYFLQQIIEPLSTKNAVVIFLSDHGEALGENGQWLHASNSEVMHKTAAFIWMSDVYKRKYPTKAARCDNNKHRRYRTDFLYHSVIDAAQIQTDILDTTLSVFR